MAALALLAALPASHAAGGPAPAKRPNFIFIFTDDHAAHAMSCYGSRINKTPQLDRLAQQGMLFRNCFVTNSICAPSRAAIITGKYSHVNGVTVFNRFDGAQPTFPKLLQAAGYHTVLIGKWHLESDPTGFDYWNIFPGQGRYYDPEMIEMGRRQIRKGYATDIITDLSIEFLKNRPADKPFLLLTHHKAPHREWSPAPRHAELYEDIDIPEPETFDDDYRGRSKAAAEARMRVDRDLTRTDLKREPPPGLSPAERKKWNYQRYIKDYLRCIAAVDEGVGKMLDYLDASGLSENTVVIYSSDQGFFLGDHNWFDKRFMYEETLRMPLLIRYPGAARPGSIDEHMVLNVDFAPTFLDLAGVPVPADMQGRSLAPLLRGESPSDWRTSMYYRYYHYPQHHQVEPHYGIRTLRHKLIYFDNLGEWELYDLERDSREMRNLYPELADSVLVARLKEELARLRRELRDDDSYLGPESLVRPLADTKVELLYRLEASAAGDRRFAKGRNGPALDLDGGGGLEVPRGSDAPGPGRRPLAAGAWCRPAGGDGVILSWGGANHGFSLYLEEGVPHFAVRAGSALRYARASQPIPMDRWTHLAGLLDASGRIRLLVGGRIAAENPAALLGANPGDGLVIGADPGSAVGTYDSPFGFRGRIEDARVYQGIPDRPELREWTGAADRF